jgi:hypothetical protein
MPGLVPLDGPVGDRLKQGSAGQRRAGGRHDGLLSRPPVGFARKAKGEDPTCDLYLTIAPTTSLSHRNVLTAISGGLVALLIASDYGDRQVGL